MFAKKCPLCYNIRMKTDLNTLPENLKGVRIHFVGIKGTGMAALVELLNKRGAVITGSDVSERFYTDEILENLGIKALPFDAANISKDIQFVIHSSAYSAEKNPELAKAEELGIPTLLYSEALGAYSALSYSAGICGVHGKTTTTGLTGTILKSVNLPSQALAGSIITSFGKSTCTMTSDSFVPGGKNYFVAETCEYQRHFMAYHPKKIVLTSVESDHQDYYPTYADIRKAFVDYICLLPPYGQLIYCADDPGAVEAAGLAKQMRQDLELVPYGTNASGPYKVSFGEVKNGRQYFTINSIGECAICVPGEHNVRNATAAVALCSELIASDGKNVSDFHEKIREGLLNFKGGKRRSEIIGSAKTPGGQDVIFIDDYGHHPTAVKSTLKGFRNFYKGHKIIVDFMSHTYSRTQALLEEFADSFGAADKVIINKIYASARESAEFFTVTGKKLAEHASFRHSDVFYCGEFDEAAKKGLELLSEPSGSQYPDGYLFVTMGAGDNWKVGQMIYDELKKGVSN